MVIKENSVNYQPVKGHELWRISGQYKKNYKSWLKQHRFLGLTDGNKERNDFALIVGPLGRMIGATECSRY